MTGDDYVTVLTRRRDAYMAERPGQPEWLVPLLEWFIRPGDEQMVTLPGAPPKRERPERTPRQFRSAASLRGDRRQLQRRLDALTGVGTGEDTAVVNLSPSSRSRAARAAGRRRMDALDRDIGKAAQLIRQIEALDARIARADYREGTR